MPDGGHEHDGRLVRRVRLQLVAWSAGSTLVVLLLLGAAVYAAVATTLASSSENLLRERATLVASSAIVVVTGSTIPTLGGGTIVGADPAGPGLIVSGPYSGTLALVIPAQADVAGVVPDPAGYAAAVSGQSILSETTYLGNPVRVVSMPLPAAAGNSPGVIQVSGDRTAELRTLGVLVVVLVGGGLLALVLAALFGSLYATRALVPIRASLRRQREFAADTSHELRTPLAVIRAGVARVRQQPDAHVSEVSPALDAVDAEAIRLGALVDDLLALARTDAGSADLDRRPVDLADIAAGALAALEPLATSRGVRLGLDVEPAPIVGDADRLRRLVTVLADNAIRHGRQNGNVAVSVRPGSLFVDDDGPGIPVADRARAFERFWRGASAAPGGSGLGLSIAAWIVERHGGSIEIGESPSGGARFTVTLPTL